MGINSFLLFSIFPETKVTFVDKSKKEYWKEWKAWKDCSNEEKEKINLRQLFPNEIILDLEETSKLPEIKELLKKDNFKYYIYNTGSRGIHVHLFFNNIQHLPIEIRNKIRENVINKYKTDLSKASERTLIALEQRPHFKTNKNKELLEEVVGENVLSDGIVIECMKKVREDREKLNNLKDIDFTDYFEKDPFWNYLNSINWEEFPMECELNNTIMPNLAIACVKTGKEEKEIERIIRPFIEKIKGYSYTEFDGWLKKAFDGIIKDYNPIQINNWIRTYTQTTPFYDLTPIPIEDMIKKKLKNDMDKITIETTVSNGMSTTAIKTIQQIEMTKKRFYTDKEFEEMPEIETQWTVEDWIAKGDICIIAGKASSFKTTLASHMLYCIGEEKLVFNKYKPCKAKCLYINEENNYVVFRNIVKRVKKGLGLEGLRSENVFLSTMENFRIDEVEDVKTIISYIKQHNIEVLFLDSFRRFFIGKENEADVINRIFNTLKFIRKECNNLTIIALHHAKKDNTDHQNNDVRDMLRGSSDIVNSPDCVIGIRRNLKQNKVVIEHIKSRGKMETLGKVLQLDDDEIEKKCYIWEVGNHQDVVEKKGKVDICSEKIISFLEEKKITTFIRKDIDFLAAEFSHDTIARAIKVLKNNGLLTETGVGRLTSYFYQK